MLRVGLSALTLVPGVVGGSETAFRSILRALHAHPEVTARVYLPSIAPDASEGHTAVVVRSYPAGTSTPKRLLAMGSALALGGRVRREMHVDGLDVLHFPFGTMVPRVSAVPTATTIHDMQHEALPELFSRGELAYRRAMYARTARASTRVIAVSRHAAEAISHHLDVPLERIRVIPQGVDIERFRPADTPRRPFLLYPANPWPHKNHARLFEAFALVRRANPELRLVLTGTGHDPRALPAGVETPGRVSTEDLVRLYQTAAALVFPSLYEGFGMPVIEAMATGCPVAASWTSSIPEVAGGAAALFDPMSVESIAAGIEDALAAPPERIARGVEHAARFTWARCAAAHVELYRELAAS